MNVSMWVKALQIIPRISKDEWQKLDVISRWLISTRAAVLIMTFLSGALAGLLAVRAGQFDLGLWLLVTLGLVMAHATNNIFNDYTDYVKGVDNDNYYRAQYGPQPLVHGLMSIRELLTYDAVTGLIAAAIGGVLIYLRGGYTWEFMALGVFFVLFYTWPLKYMALGELAVLVVWGPLMIGGGYYVIAGAWDWRVVLASLPYALGVTTVIFGKHIDKVEADRAKHIHTLPVLIGEKAGRFAVMSMVALQYLLVVYLIAIHFFTPVMLAVVLALPTLLRIWPIYRAPKPAEKPADYSDVWPNYYVAAAFVHNRAFGVMFLLALVADTVLKGGLLAGWMH